MTTDSFARTVMERCDALAGISEEPGRITRRFATEAMRRANEMVAGCMRAAGMSVRQDNAGNLIGRYEAASENARTMLLGSHLDSVRDAGRYDGPLGVLIALACVERLHERGERLPFAVEVLAFADEEGLRYHTTYLGSEVVAGTFDPANLDLIDSDGITMAEAIRRFGGDPGALPGDRRRGDDLIGYCEAHIEQGPVLEDLNLPIGVVAAIAGQNRYTVTFNGEAGHAGTVPMRLRRDALCAAAEFVLAVESEARGRTGLVATVGQIEARPGASNVIAGEVVLSLDVRHQDDAERIEACHALQERAGAIAEARGVSCAWRILQQKGAVPCAAQLTETLTQAIESLGYPAHALTSGAGHDAVALAALAPTAMLFVRCKGGISHNPAESVAEADVAVAIDAMSRFLALLAR